MTKKSFLTIVSPLSIALTFLVEFHWESTNIVDYPDLYGFIYPIRSSAMHTSFGYEYYIKGILISLLFFGFISWGVNFLIQKYISNTTLLKGLIILIWLIFFIAIIPRILFIQDAIIKWDYNHATLFIP